MSIEPIGPGRNELPDRLTFKVEEAARLLGIGRQSAYMAAANGTLPTIRIGRRVLVPRAALSGCSMPPAKHDSQKKDGHPAESARQINRYDTSRFEAMRRDRIFTLTLSDPSTELGPGCSPFFCNCLTYFSCRIIAPLRGAAVGFNDRVRSSVMGAA